MLFRSKKKANEMINDKKEIETTNENSSSKQKKLTISAVENALLKAVKTEDKILLLKIAGDAYASGENGAQQDYQKAIEKYKMAVDLGSAECEHSLGTTYIMESFDAKDEDAKLIFSAGVNHVICSYKKGYEPARDTLQYIIDDGTFANCKTVEDLLKLSETIWANIK